MGLLSDEPTTYGSAGEGEKLVRLYLDVFDDEDRERLRRWVEDEEMTAAEVWRRLCRVDAYKMGRSSVQRALPRLKALWAS